MYFTCPRQSATEWGKSQIYPILPCKNIDICTSHWWISTLSLHNQRCNIICIHLGRTRFYGWKLLAAWCFMDMICSDLHYFPVICKYLISGCVLVTSQIAVMIIRTNENSESSPMDQLLPALMYIRNFRVCMMYIVL